MALGDRTEARLAGPMAITTSNSTVGTVPGSRVWVIKQVTLCNTNNGTEALVKLAIGSTATAGNCFMSNLPIAGNDTVVLDTSIVLSAGETIQTAADRTGVNVILYGWIKEV